MKISSTAFKHNKMIPKEYTCEGEGLNPPLTISEPPPEGTKSLALIVHDHDGPEGDFVHWVVWNIDPKIKEMKEGLMPVDAQEGKNDAGESGWVPPCPPSGRHRYEFSLYALNAIIDLPTSSDKHDLRKEMIGRILEETSIVGFYEKMPV